MACISSYNLLRILPPAGGFFTPDERMVNIQILTFEKD
nr:MAG TPA: hypothetical protein [Bacteriophage sp.]